MSSQRGGKSKGKARSPGKPADQGQGFNMLDAYTDTASSTTSCAAKDESRPVTKKNKNKKKREAEAERQRQLSESKKPEDDGPAEVIDSWEDLDATVDESAKAPRTIELPPVEAKSTPKNLVKTHQPTPADDVCGKMRDLKLDEDPTLAALKKLDSTMEKIDALFKKVPKVEVKKSQAEPAADVSGEEKTSSASERSREEVMAEREAKKKAKAAAKAGVGAKSGENSKEARKEPVEKQSDGDEADEKQKFAVPEKSKEEIMAEREAKKKAKAAAKAGGGTAVKKTPKQDDGQAEPSGKSNAELKAERRAKQEEQRAKKVAAAKEKAAEKSEASEKVAGKASIRVPSDVLADCTKSEKKLAKKLASAQIPPRTQAQRKVMLFSHLHQYEREFSVSRTFPIVGCHIHPAIMTLGLQYSEGTITGSNARCLALLGAMKAVLSSYRTPENSDLSRDLNDKLKTYITFLKECRPLSVSMGNAIRFLKAKINAVKAGTDDDKAKASLIDAVDVYVHHNIVLAAEQIAITACEKIRDGDVILTYGCSSLLRKVFQKAISEGRKFRVIIADGRPRCEGKEMARHMVNANIHCTYVLVSAVPYIITEVTKVFLGAHAVMANGCVMSRVGSSQVALVAKAFNVPVLVCCETYKFSERVQTDSFVFNELGDPDDLVSSGQQVNTLEHWRSLSSLTLLNLNYDVTPASLVDAIISEISVIPGTSVPVVLRLKNLDHAA